MKKQSKRLILLVDDEPDSLEPISILLEQEYRVVTAESGRAAMDLLEGAAAEVIIADQRMPGMTGVELLAHVRERYPAIVRLILTAYTDFDAMLKAINEGRVYRYIIKPWDPEDMMLIIRQAFDWKDLREAQGQLAADLAEAHQALVLRNKEIEEARATILAQEKLAAVGRFAAEMAHEISFQHGTITCDDTPDGGTTFTVRIPGKEAG
jgi:response regulator RpfG family c-di-GMP phosphodiesterase